MINKIKPDDLQKLLAYHLEGTALEGLAERVDYVTGPDGFVAAKTIDNICNVFKKTIHLFKILPGAEKPDVKQQVIKIEKAMEVIFSFGSKAN